jgi:hypothetical protein
VNADKGTEPVETLHSVGFEAYCLLGCGAGVKAVEEFCVL